MEQWSEIRRRILVDGVSQRQILRETGMHWETLQKILNNSEPPGYRQSQPRPCKKLGPYRPKIELILREDQALPRKQRHTAKRIWDRLKAEGFTGGYTIVKTAVRELTRRCQEVFVPLIHRPGEAQVDFGEALVKLNGKRRKVAFLVMALPSDNVLMIAVEFGMANQYIRDLSVNIRRGIREKVRRGVFSGRAPLGYVNDPRLRTIEPHPEMFPKVKRLLELFATGDYTLTALQQEATKLGIVGRQNNKPVLHLSTLGNLLRCQFYYGVFVHKGELHQGMHVPMIAKKTFDEIQAALVAVAKPRKRQDLKGFFFLDFATCGSCGHCITGERHIKTSGRRFHYYRCTHKGPACEERVYLRDEKFNEEVKRNVQLVTLPKEWMERFLDKMETSKEEAATEAQDQIP